MDTAQLVANAEQAGYAPHTVDIIQATATAISSGDVALPFSQAQAENALLADNPAAVLDLLFAYPEFIQVAVDYYVSQGQSIS